MSKRQRRNNTPGGAVQPNSVHLRWRNVANPSTPRDEIMSSPDPLNGDASPDQILSSNSRRITRSQRSHQFLSLGATPRRLAWELDAGTGRARPPRGGLIVSVEETDEDGTANEATRRTKVPTPSPRASSAAKTRGRKRAAATATTTTTVPLKYSIEDESSDVLGSTTATPLPRKTRIRVSNGTPIPKPITGKRRRDPSPPARTTQRHPETVEDSMDSDSMDELTQRSPTPKRRKPSPRGRVAEPSSELGTEPAPRVSPSARRNVRRRRYPMAPPQVPGSTDVGNTEALMPEVPTSEDDLQRDVTTTVTVEETRQTTTAAAEAEPESDIWIAAASRDVTPQAEVSEQPADTTADTTAAEMKEGEEEEREEARETSIALSQEDYGYLPPAASDDSSIEDEQPAEPTIMRANDTIAQGEDFSMILMDSIHSLRESTQGAPPASQYRPVGDDTNLIINNTLEYLRQGEVADPEDGGEEEQDDDADTAGTLSDRESENDPAEDGATSPEPVVADLPSGSEVEAQPKKSQPEATESDELDEHDEPETSDSRESENEPAEEESAAALEPVVVDVKSAPGLEGQPDASEPELVAPAAKPESESKGDTDDGLESELDEIEQQDVAQLRLEVEQEVAAELEAAVTEIVAVEPVLELEAEAPLSRMSPIRQSPPASRSARLSQLPKKVTGSSPLRYRVYKRYSGQSEGSPRGSPRGSLRSSPRASPRRSASPSQTTGSVSASAPVQESAKDSLIYEDSFSEIPSAILAAAVPRENERTAEYEELNDEQMDEIMDELVNSQTQDAATANFMQYSDEDPEFELERGEEQQADDYELPYLSPGTGAGAEPSEDALMEESSDDSQDDEQAADEVSEEVAVELPTVPSDARETRSEIRLPTPDESPPSAPPQQALAPAQQQPRAHSFFGSPVQAHHLPGPSSLAPSAHSVPATQPAEAAAQGSASPVEETPRNQISSPIQQPQSPGQESASAPHVRPALSSIVRVGRALQSVTSDPPSPEARDRHLGSPFRSSASKEPRSGSRETETGRSLSKSPSARVSKSPTARMLTFGRLSQSSLSPQRRSPFGDAAKSIRPPTATANQPQAGAQQESVSPPRSSLFSKSTSGTERPPSADLNPVEPPGQPRTSASPPPQSLFNKSTRAAALDEARPSASPQRKSPFRERSRSVESLPLAGSSFDEAPRAQGSAPGHVSATSSLHQSPSSDDMSWIANEGPISPRLRGDNTLQEVVATSTGTARRSPLLEHSTESERAPELESGAESDAYAEAELELPPLRKDEDTDIWDIETYREQRRKASFGKKVVRDRSRLAATTTKPKPTQDAPAWMRRVMPQPENRAFKPLLLKRTRQPAVEERGSPSRQEEQQPLLEEDAEEYSLLSRTKEAEETQGLSESAAKASKFDLSTFFSSPIAIPGMIANKFFSRKGKSVETPAPAPAPASELHTPAPAPAPAPVTPPVPAPELHTPAPVPAPAPAPELDTPAPTPALARERLPTRASSLASTPRYSHRNSFRPFRPTRPRYGINRQTLGTPSLSGFGVTASNREGALEANRLFARPETSAVPSEDVGARRQAAIDKVFNWQSPKRWGCNSMDSDDSEYLSMPYMRELPPKNASPVKSSMRSPSKPKRRGRVVEFSSSVMSPPAQALARQERRQREYEQELFKQEQELRQRQGSMLFDQEDVNRYEPPHRRVVSWQQAMAELEGSQGEGSQGEGSQGSSDVSMPDAPPLEQDDEDEDEVEDEDEEAEEEEEEEEEPTQEPAQDSTRAARLARRALLSTRWSRWHWLFLDELLQTRRLGPFRGHFSRHSESLLGKMISGKGRRMKLERWHLDCLDAFKARISGWDAPHLARRLFGLIMGELERGSVGL